MDSDKLSALPQAFLQRMEDMLGDDFEPFLAAYEQPLTYGPVSYTHLCVSVMFFPPRLHSKSGRNHLEGELPE